MAGKYSEYSWKYVLLYSPKCYNHTLQRHRTCAAVTRSYLRRWQLLVSTAKLRIFSSYLENHKQYVVVDSFPSETLLVGPRSVTQGSTLSCVSVPHTPQEYSKCSRQVLPQFTNCSQTNSKSYVDDNFLQVKPKPEQTLQDSATETIRKVEDYMNANMLSLNPEKSRIIVISKDKNLIKDFSMNISGKNLVHQKKMLILCNIISEDLTWDNHVKSIVIPALANRARSLKLSTCYMDRKFKKLYSTAIFMGKMTFAIDAWAGANKTLLSKVLALQDRVAKATLGNEGAKMYSNASRRWDGWMSARRRPWSHSGWPTRWSPRSSQQRCQSTRRTPGWSLHTNLERSRSS